MKFFEGYSALYKEEFKYQKQAKIKIPNMPKNINLNIATA